MRCDLFLLLEINLLDCASVGECCSLRFPAGTAASLWFNAPGQALAWGSYEGFKILYGAVAVMPAALLNANMVFCSLNRTFPNEHNCESPGQDKTA